MIYAFFYKESIFISLHVFSPDIMLTIQIYGRIRTGTVTYYVLKCILPKDIFALDYSFEVFYIWVYKTTDICSYQFRDFSAYMLLFFVCVSP